MTHFKTAFLSAALFCLLVFGARAEDISGSGWRLWLDRSAIWQNDPLFLPSEINLEKMPVNPPTGGWTILSNHRGIPVTLPSTVEEHYWGAFGLRPYDPATEYGGAAADPGVKNGNYLGVSWWWRTLRAPPLAPGQRLVIRFRGARLRAEVYCNGRLCGYQILPELPFEADVTAALRPGADNLLAIRITNPGGRLDWRDPVPFRWGRYEIPSSLGFGGLDAGIEMEVRDGAAVDDLAVLNTPEPRRVRLLAEVRAPGRAFDGEVRFAIMRNGETVWTTATRATIGCGATSTITIDAFIPGAELWELDHPALYRASAELAGLAHSARATPFGFRWFAPADIGSDARFQLNGRRIVLRSAISWGFWAPSGLWPDTELAEAEVGAAAALGFNCINSHRNLARPAVLDAQDRRGVLRVEEPGAGGMALGDGPSTTTQPLDTSGQGGEPRNFAERYEEEKIIQMVRRDRSHPSLAVYCIQNEMEPRLWNPRVWRVLRRVHEADPSRTVVLKSGVRPEGQAFMLPYDDCGLNDFGTTSSGWCDIHTVGGPGNWIDAAYHDPPAFTSTEFGPDRLYINPGMYSHRAQNRSEIRLWGEMLGVGAPDDHEAIVNWYREEKKTGYDLADHQEILKSYDRFLKRWGFRGAFPTDSALFQAAGAKSYFFWRNIIENCRITDPLDGFMVSGWESTAIENHSGLLDARRGFKADPEIIRQAMAPERLVIRPRQRVVSLANTISVDLFLINETGRRGPQWVTLEAKAPDGRALFSARRPAEALGGEVYGQPLAADLRLSATAAGTLTLDAALEGEGGRLTNREEVLVVDPVAAEIPRRVIVAGGGQVAWTLYNIYHTTPFAPGSIGNPADAIVFASTAAPGTLLTSAEPIAGTAEPGLYQRQMFGMRGTVAQWIGLAPGPCRVELHFAETYWTRPGERVFDVELNGRTVLRNFDILREAGRGRALVKRFAANAAGGMLTLRVPWVAADNATLAAIKIVDAAGKVTAMRFADAPYTDGAGVEWRAFSSLNIADELLRGVLRQVKRDGTRLVFWTEGGADARSFAQALARLGALKFEGMVGSSPAPWMGSWYFARRHWLFDGLPADCVMDWRWQAPGFNSGEDGLLISARGMEVAAGYGRDHSANVGIGACVIPWGKGKIVLFCLPGMTRALIAGPSSLAQPIAQRLLGNALK